jgi:hypothetical protein
VICDQCRDLRYRLILVQREARRQLREYNRHNLPRDSAVSRRERIASVMAMEISWRSCILMQIQWQNQKDKCGGCSTIDLYRRLRHDNVLKECLRSSMAEQPIRNRQVLSSSLGAGSNLSEVSA